MPVGSLIKGCVLPALLVLSLMNKHSDCRATSYVNNRNDEDIGIPDNNIGDTDWVADESNPWQLCTDKAPEDDLLWPTVGNGHVATVVHSQRVFMNGLYSGNGTESSRARIPAFTSLLVNTDTLNYTNSVYCLYMHQGLFVERYVADHWAIEVTWYAHRTIPSLLVNVLRIRTDGQQEAFHIDVDINQGNDSAGLNLTEGTSEIANSSYVYGEAKVAETKDSGRSPVHIYYTVMPARVDVPGGTVENMEFLVLASISPFKQTAVDDYELGFRQQDRLEEMHIRRWQELWDSGRLDILGNTNLASAAYSAMYYITSSMPVDEGDPRWPFIGLSPSDLAHGPRWEEYKGHVFWDQDTWMFPPVLLLHADLGKTLIKTRIRTLDAAFALAQQTGYRGARYPWESAFTGFEACPAPEYGEYEVHVTGDVAMAVRQYLMMTRDTELLKNDRLKEEILGIAEFWRSRSVYNEDYDRYEIHDVMPPDEWNYPVNNSAYTNAVAKLSLLLPKFAMGLVGEKAPPEYEAIAMRMFIPLDTKLQYHPEFDGFTDNVTVKQADVILLGFPLELDMTAEQRRNDLIIYANVTPSGPAMTWSMFSIGWLELNDLQMANETFHRQLLNKREPFNVWSEYSNGEGAKNFITGQGGFLQSVMFGYGGLRIRQDRITIDCKIIPDTLGFRFKGLDYLGNSIDVTCNVTHLTITLTRESAPLFLKLLSSKEIFGLHLNQTLSVYRQAVAITDAANSGATLDSPVDVVMRATAAFYRMVLQVVNILSNVV